MTFRTILATALCAALVSPSAAQIRTAAPSYRAPAAGAPVPLIGGWSAPLSPLLNAGLSIQTAALASAAAAPAAAPAVLKPAAAQPKAMKAAAKTRARRSPASVKSESASAAALRSKEESFWSGSKDKPAGEEPVVVDAAPQAAQYSGRRIGPLLAAPVVAAGALLAPAVPLPTWTSALVPFAEGAGVLAGVYALTHAARWAIDKFIPRFGGGEQDIVAAKYAANVVLWAGGVGLALNLFGVPAAVLFATFGAGGMAFFSTIKVVVGNLFNAGHFLIARPFTIGDKVTIGKATGVVKELTLRRLILSDETGGLTRLTYSKVAAEVITLYGRYNVGEHAIGARLSLLPGGMLNALRETRLATLVKPLLYAALAAAALFSMPLLQAYLVGSSISWLTAAVPYLKAAVIAILTGSLTRPLRAIVDRAGWDASTATIVKALISTTGWLIGGSFILNAVGFTWTTVAATASIASLIIGVALIDYVNAVVHGALLLWEKPFKIGDQVRVGDHAGAVVDITPQHVILKIADDQYKMIPHAVVKDSPINSPQPVLRPK